MKSRARKLVLKPNLRLYFRISFNINLSNKMYIVVHQECFPRDLTLNNIRHRIKAKLIKKFSVFIIFTF